MQVSSFEHSQKSGTWQAYKQYIEAYKRMSESF